MFNFFRKNELITSSEDQQPEMLELDEQELEGVTGGRGDWDHRVRAYREK